MATPDDYTNNTSTTGKLVIPATGAASINGVIEEWDDHDWFSVTLIAGKHYAFSFNADYLNWTSTLALHNSKGAKLPGGYFDAYLGDGKVDYSTTGKGLVTFTPLESGTYYLDATNEFPTHKYTLFAREKQDDYGDYPAQAHDINLFKGQDFSIASHIEDLPIGQESFKPDDEDWFKVNLLAGTTYQIALPEIKNATGGYVHLSLRDGKNELVFADGGNEDMFFFTPKTTGDFYVVVEGGVNKGSFAYKLDVFEKEKHDDFGDSAAKAHALALLPGQDLAVKGQIEGVGDQDWFKIDLVAGTHYRIAALNTAITIYDANNKVVATPSEPIYFFTPTASGSYYTAVQSRAGKTDYSLEFKEVQDDFAANNTTTGVLAVDKETTGAIESKGDHDWFKVTVEADTTYQFNYSSETPNIAMGFTLHNAAGGNEKLSFGDSAYFTATKAGDYYLDVSALTGSGNQPTGVYKLTMAPVADDYPNHLSDIKPLVVGEGVKLSWNNDFAEDQDWIPVQLEAGKSYAIHNLYEYSPPYDNPLSIPSHIDEVYNEAFVFVRDQQGQLVPQLASKGADFTFSVTSTGRYYLDISVTGTDIQSFLTYYKRFITPYKDDYVANSTTSAQIKPFDKQTVLMDGRIEEKGDHDWFKVSLVAGKHYLFSVNASAVGKDPLSSPVLQLYDDTYKALLNDATSKQSAFTSPTSGDFFIDVSAHNTVKYTLSVAQKDDDYGNSRASTGPFEMNPGNSEVSRLIGAVEKPGDHDWIAVKLLAGKAYHFELSGDASQPVADKLTTVALSLYDANGQLLEKGAGPGNVTALIDYTPVKSDTYYLDAAALSNTATGGYTLKATSDYDDFPDYATTGTPIAFGHETIVNLGFKGDHDWIPIQMIAGNNYLFSLGVISADLDYTLPMFVLRDTNGKPVPGTTFPAMTFFDYSHVVTANKTGLFYLDISPSKLFYGPDSLSLFVDAFKDDYADNARTTGKLDLTPSGFHSVNGKWSPTPVEKGALGDHDWFKISLKAGQHYTFALTDKNGEFAASKSLALVDSKGQAVKLPPLTVSATEGGFTLIAPGTGIYYLDAYSYGVFGTIPYILKGQQNAPVGTGHRDVLIGGSGSDLIFGLGGDDTLSGGLSGNDVLQGGAGKDFMIGGAGSDVYYVDDKGDRVKETSTISSEIDTVHSTVNFTLPANVENLVLSQLTDGTVMGRGNGLANTLTGASSFGMEILRGGAGNDTLISNHGFKEFYHYGEAGNDRLIGNTNGNGYFVGGMGKDICELKGGASNSVIIARSDSMPSSFDVIKGYWVNQLPNRLDLASKQIAKDAGSLNGKDVGSLHSHHISKGLISFDDLNTYTTPLAITADKIADAIKYLQTNITKPGDTVAFVAGHDTYVFQDGGSVDTLVQLVGVTADGIHNTAVTGSIFLV